MHCASPCYEHAPAPFTYGTLPDLLNSQNPGISWKYCTPLVQNGVFQSGLWVAPAAIKHLCGEIGNSGQCDALLTGQYAGNIRQETVPHPYPLVDDINACQLAAVSWGIPDKRRSDHGSEEPMGLGPAYVANIVNAIGGNTNCKDTSVGTSAGPGRRYSRSYKFRRFNDIL